MVLTWEAFPLLRAPAWCLLLVVTGCGSQQDAPALGLAQDFYAALAARDGAAACRTLAPETLSELEASAGKPCATAILEERLPDVGEPEGVEVFGTMAQVRYAGESAFLTRFADGWRVMAAGCLPRPVDPYQCRVEGG